MLYVIRTALHSVICNTHCTTQCYVQHPTLHSVVCNTLHYIVLYVIHTALHSVTCGTYTCVVQHYTLLIHTHRQAVFNNNPNNNKTSCFCAGWVDMARLRRERSAVVPGATPRGLHTSQPCQREMNAAPGGTPLPVVCNTSHTQWSIALRPVHYCDST